MFPYSLNQFPSLKRYHFYFKLLGILQILDPPAVFTPPPLAPLPTVR